MQAPMIRSVAMRPMRVLLSMLLLALTACASSGPSLSALEKAQYAYSAAIRWGDIDGAWAQVEPAYKQAHPLTSIERARYAQVQVTGYRPVDSQALGEGESLRVIEIGVVNRNTMAERSMRYQERWRYDAAAKTWYVTSGLPDFWAGQ